MSDAPGPAPIGSTADDPEGGVDVVIPTVRPVGNLLVAAALVFAAAVVASSAATVISVVDADLGIRLIDELHLAARQGVTLLHAGLLVGAALLLVAAEFHDVDSPWYPRALGIVAALASIAVVAAAFVALDVPSWSQGPDVMSGIRPESPSATDRIVVALGGLSVAAIAAVAAAACWMLASGRIDFGHARPQVGVAGDDPQ